MCRPAVKSAKTTTPPSATIRGWLPYISSVEVFNVDSVLINSGDDVEADDLLATVNLKP